MKSLYLKRKEKKSNISNDIEFFETRSIYTISISGYNTEYCNVVWQ